MTSQNKSESSVPRVLPPPFEWIEIPAGQVTLKEEYWTEGYLTKGQSKVFDVARFQIAKYPITNAQYAKFVAADGYNNRAYWTDIGWQALQKGNWTEPRYWYDSKFNSSEQPVMGVSWFEVYAFTQWLSDITGEVIRLPTEQQWQRAAQGDDNRVYPWGNEWDSSRCQNKVDGDTDSTSAVTAYEEKGDSPSGVVDMVGNVYAWCLTGFESGTQKSNVLEQRILRGGSWGSKIASDFRVSTRSRQAPALRFGNWGCRCVRLDG